MKVFVTGGTGFIGFHLVESLLQSGHEVTCLVRETSDTSWLDQLENVQYHYGELMEPDSLTDAVKDQDWIFHLAGVVIAVNRDGYVRVNRNGTENLIRAIREHNPDIQKFVYVSSLSAGGPASPDEPRTEADPDMPVSHYGESKLLSENVLQNYMAEIPITILRPGIVYGPMDVGALSFFQIVDQGWRARFIGKELYLSMIYVDDFVDALLRVAVTDECSGNMYYLSDDEIYSMTKVQELIGEALDKKPRMLPVPRFLLYPAVFFSEIIIKTFNKPSFFNYQKIKEMTQTAWVCSPERFKKDSGFHPQYPLRAGAQMTADWYRQHGWL